MARLASLNFIAISVSWDKSQTFQLVLQRELQEKIHHSTIEKLWDLRLKETQLAIFLTNKSEKQLSNLG